MALAVVVLAGAAALAIDGSMVMNERRKDQSTADSAALAGAGAAVQITKDHMPGEFYCGSTLASHASIAAILAAQDIALSDHLTLVQGDTNNGIIVTCASDNFSTYLDIRIIVTTNTQTTFARMLSRNQLTTRVESTARVYPKQTLANGNALAAVGNTCADGLGGIGMVGGASVTTKGGGVFSNSCINGGTINLTGIGSVQWNGPGDTISTTVTGGIKKRSIDPLPAIEQPQNPCTKPPGGVWPTTVIQGNNTFSPGYYGSINSKNTKTTGTHLLPGLYCIKNDVITDANGNLWGTRVTIFVDQGDISFGANSDVSLTAPDCETSDSACGVPPAIRGILFYLNPIPTHTFSFAPGRSAYFEGTILGTTTSMNLQGHADPDSFHTQIIVNNYGANGNTALSINMDGAEIYQKASSIELLK